MSLIDPRAIIDPAARLADDVQVGPWSIIGPDVEIGEGTVIASHVVIKGPTRIGRHNRIYQFSSVGEDTPDLKYKGEPTRLVIGDHNVIREGVTIHRGTVQDRSETTIGDHNLIMAYAHIGHDSVIANHCILVNNTALAGHVHVGTGRFCPATPWSTSSVTLGRTASPAWGRRLARMCRHSSPYSATRQKRAA